MKKILLALSLLLIIPITAFADEELPKVLSLEATAEGVLINYNGTTEADSHAVMCKLYDSKNKEIDMLSVAVDNKKFEGTFTAPKAGEYKVACANYEGGAIKETTVTTEEVIKKYTVTFYTNGGSNIAPVDVESGAKVSKPKDPTKDEYIFVSWCVDETLTTDFDFNSPITNNTKLYAKWKKEPVAVHTIFFGKGGTYIVDFETDDPENQGPMAAPINKSSTYFVPAGKEMTLTAIHENGFEFIGWYRGNVDAQTEEEWPTNELLSKDTVYKFTPTGTPYIVPVFEENRVFTVYFNTTGGSNIGDAEVKSNETVEKPKDPTRDNFTFVGWYEDETLTTEFNFDTKITDNVTLYAKWEEDDNTEEYTVTDDYGNSITFSEEEGHEFNLVIIDIMKLSDEELAEFDITREEYNEVEKNLKAALSDHGTLLSFYDISVFDEDENNKGNGPFKIKIKMTEEMKKYNSFKILYVDVDEEITIEKSITLKIEDGYLVGTLPHLSNYALMGSIVTDNPKTLDNIYVWIITLMISFVGLTVVTVFTKKPRNKKTR